MRLLMRFLARQSSAHDHTTHQGIFQIINRKPVVSDHPMILSLPAGAEPSEINNTSGILHSANTRSNIINQKS
jgi:hypothetical protein